MSGALRTHLGDEKCVHRLKVNQSEDLGAEGRIIIK